MDVCVCECFSDERETVCFQVRETSVTFMCFYKCSCFSPGQVSRSSDRCIFLRSCSTSKNKYGSERLFLYTVLITFFGSLSFLQWDPSK